VQPHAPIAASALHAKNNMHDALHFTEPLRVQVVGHLDVFVVRPGDLEGEACTSSAARSTCRPNEAPLLGYVEYMMSMRRSQPYPIVMVHGGGQTGTNFIGTPDGCEGWAQ